MIDKTILLRGGFFINSATAELPR